MAERDLRYGKPILEGFARARSGGGFGAFKPPVDATGKSVPLNRKGVTTKPVEKLKSPSREFVDALSPDAKKQLQDKYFPRKIEDAPPTKMQLRKEQRRADYEATQEQGLDERNKRRTERAARFGVDLKYNKGGMIKGAQCRDYGKK